MPNESQNIDGEKKLKITDITHKYSKQTIGAHGNISTVESHDMYYQRLSIW